MSVRASASPSFYANKTDGSPITECTACQGHNLRNVITKTKNVLYGMTFYTWLPVTYIFLSLNPIHLKEGSENRHSQFAW